LPQTITSESRVYLARHGQTPYNAELRFQGQGAVPLNDTGRVQADELGRLASTHKFLKLWCSPLLRARETADIVSGHIGLEPHEDSRLMETATGNWTDCSFAEIEASAPQQFAAFIRGDAGFAFPGGESFAEQQVRVMAALSDVERDRCPALVVCHGQVIRLALEHRRGRALAAGQRVKNGELVALGPARHLHTSPDDDGSVAI
jgi:probable phosphoglycerate mutase